MVKIFKEVVTKHQNIPQFVINDVDLIGIGNGITTKFGRHKILKTVKPYAWCEPHQITVDFNTKNQHNYIKNNGSKLSEKEKIIISEIILTIERFHTPRHCP